MKKFYFVLFFLITSLTSCFGQLSAADLKKKSVQRELLKEYYLCVCITEAFKDKHISDDDISQSVYFDILSYSPEAFEVVKDSAIKFVETIMEPSPNIHDHDTGNKRAVIMRCIEKYKSKDTKKFIKSLDKYYLKD